MANNFGGGYFTILDHDRETSTTGFTTGAITALNLGGPTGVLVQFGALRTAIQGIISGTMAGEGLYVNRTKLSNTPPADEGAQRERKWLVVYEDNTEYFDPPINAIPNAGFRQIYNIEIATADPVGRLLPNTDIADLTETSMAAFVTAFEALARSPAGGAVNVQQILLVGRSS